MNVEKKCESTVGPTGNDTFEDKKAAQNNRKAFKTIRRVKELMSLLSDTLRKCVPYTRYSKEIIMAVSMHQYH